VQNALTVLVSLAPPPAVSGVLGGVARPFEPIESMLATAAFRCSSNLVERKENNGGSGKVSWFSKYGDLARAREGERGRKRELMRGRRREMTRVRGERGRKREGERKREKERRRAQTFVTI